MADLTYTIEVALGGTLTDPRGEKVKIAGFACASGRPDQFEDFPAGTCTFKIKDFTGDLIPDGGGTYSDETWVGREVQITANAGGLDNVIWRGHVEDIDIDFIDTNHSEIMVHAVDPFALLGRTIIDAGTGFSSELSSTRIDNVLGLSEVDGGYFTSATKNFDTGEVTLQAETDAGGNTLQYLQLVARSEGGRLFIAHGGPTGGVLTFKSRNADTPDSGLTFTYQGPGSGSLASGGTAATATFEDTWDGGDAATSTFGRTLDGGDATTRFEIPYRRVDVQYGSELLTNRVTYTRVGGTAQTAENAASQSRYGIRSVSESGLLMATDAEALSAAEFRMFNSYQPQRHVEALTVLLSPLTDDQAAMVLGVTVGDRIKVVEPIPGSANTFESNVRVERVAHQATPSVHTVQFAVSTLGVEPAKWDEDSWNAPDAIWGI